MLNRCVMVNDGMQADRALIWGGGSIREEVEEDWKLARSKEER